MQGNRRAARLMFHESEEYVLSPMSFKEFFNLKTFAGSRSDPDYPLDESYVFQVNLVFAWPIIVLGVILAPVVPWLVFSMIWHEFLPAPALWNLDTADSDRLFHPVDWALSIAAGAAIVAFLGPGPGDGWPVYKEPEARRSSNRHGT